MMQKMDSVINIVQAVLVLFEYRRCNEYKNDAMKSRSPTTPPFIKTARIMLCGPTAKEDIYFLYQSPSTKPCPQMGDSLIILSAESHISVRFEKVMSLFRISIINHLASSLFSNPFPWKHTKILNSMAQKVWTWHRNAEDERWVTYRLQ